MTNYIQTIEGKVDYIKATIDHFKFMVTISSAFIVAVLTLLEKVFSASDFKFLAYLSITSFVLSIFFAIYAHIMCVDALQYQDSSNGYVWEKAGPGKSVLICWSLFSLGIVLICSFVIAGQW